MSNVDLYTVNIYSYYILRLGGCCKPSNFAIHNSYSRKKTT